MVSYLKGEDVGDLFWNCPCHKITDVSLDTFSPVSLISQDKGHYMENIYFKYEYVYKIWFKGRHTMRQSEEVEEPGK